jgi:uncharacterized RDD family membrane protein YckC
MSMWEEAGLTLRTLAFILDLLLLVVLKEAFSLVWPAKVSYPWLGVAILYFTFWTGYTGQTLGKWALKLRVTDPLGLSIGYPQAFLRTLGYLLDALPMGLGFFWIIRDREKRGWHDLIARTRVYKT